MVKRDASFSPSLFTHSITQFNFPSSVVGCFFDLCPVLYFWQLYIIFLCAYRFQVTGLIEGQWYAYRVRAVNKLGASRPCRATDEIQAVDAKGRLQEKLKEMLKFWHNFRLKKATLELELHMKYYWKCKKFFDTVPDLCGLLPDFRTYHHIQTSQVL